MTNIKIQKIKKKQWNVIGVNHNSDGTDFIYTTTNSLNTALDYFNKFFKRLNWTLEVI